MENKVLSCHRDEKMFFTSLNILLWEGGDAPNKVLTNKTCHVEIQGNQGNM
jgi:hypothetical protein